MLYGYKDNAREILFQCKYPALSVNRFSFDYSTCSSQFLSLVLLLWVFFVVVVDKVLILCSSHYLKYAYKLLCKNGNSINAYVVDEKQYLSESPSHLSNGTPG